MFDLTTGHHGQGKSTHKIDHQSLQEGSKWGLELLSLEPRNNTVSAFAGSPLPWVPWTFADLVFRHSHPILQSGLKTGLGDIRYFVLGHTGVHSQIKV